MTRIVRAALTQTRNAYREMPESTEELASLSDKMPAIRDANIQHHLELITAAAELKVQALCMGELFTGPYFALDRTPMWRELAEDASEGPSVVAMQQAARTHKILIVAPIYELDAATGRRFNTAVVIENDGSILGKYRKCHIPEGTNDANSFCETFYYERSDGKLDNGSANVSKNDFFPVFESSVGKIGVAICYDRHFHGVMKTLAAEGAELVFSPAVTFGQKSRAMWEMEFAVDAARHNLFIGGSNRIGSEPPWNQEFFGASYFVGPNGRPAALAARDELIVADLDLDQLSGADPSGWDLSRDLRPDIY
jgi:N-carbamoylputrescine amidase